MKKLNNLTYILLFLSFLIGISVQTFIKYPVDSFTLPQLDITIQSPDENANSASVQQTDANVPGGKRYIFSYITPFGTTISSGTSTISVPGDNTLLFTSTPSDPFPYYQMNLGYNGFTFDVTDALGLQVTISNSDNISFTASVTTSQGTTGKQFSHPASNGVLQIPFSEMTANPAVTSITWISQISLTISSTNGILDVSLMDIGIYASQAPDNSEFSGAVLAVPTVVIPFDSTNSPDNVFLTQCSEISQSSSFLWYKIAPTNTFRVISVSTCDTAFDTVLAVFSGDTFNSLTTVACNDDVSDDYLESGCNPTSSFVSNIHINVGETIYIVVGGYIDTNSQTVESGEGALAITLLQYEDIPVDLEILIQQRDIIIDAISDGGVNVIDEIDATAISLGNQIGDVKSDTSSLLSIVTPLRSNIKTDTAQVLFTQTYLNYLSDSKADPPLNIRMPKAYGGKLEDIADEVAAIYNDLKTKALAIGTKGSTACNFNLFCKYFMGTAEPAYLLSLNKFNDKLSNNYFQQAYLNLQKAYTSLYPTSW